jgi:hypothetical protein
VVWKECGWGRVYQHNRDKLPKIREIKEVGSKERIIESYLVNPSLSP